MEGSNAALPLARDHGIVPLMVAHKAHVENGRIVIDEPTDLPEGTVLEVGNVEVLDEEDDMDDEERASLHQALDEAIASVNAGQGVDGDEVIRRLLNRP
jgi:hypothetical protein